MNINFQKQGEMFKKEKEITKKELELLKKKKKEITEQSVKKRQTKRCQKI